MICVIKSDHGVLLEYYMMFMFKYHTNNVKHDLNTNGKSLHIWESKKLREDQSHLSWNLINWTTQNSLHVIVPLEKAF